jgi:hypothetical protein
MANRVTSVLAIFLGRMDFPFNTDTLDPGQGVELKWDQLLMGPDSGELAALLKARLPALRATILASRRPGAAAAAGAIDVILSLLDDSIGEAERVIRVSGLALGVALAMDATAVPPPDGQRLWAAFELRGQADLFDRLADEGLVLTDEFVDDLRTESGMQSMAYRNAMKRV